MSNELYELLGLDPADPKLQDAEQDANDYAHLIEQLVAARKRNGLKQKDIRIAMGTTQSAVSDVERIGSDPRISTVQRYARAVGAHLRLMAVYDGGYKPMNNPKLPTAVGSNQTVFVTSAPDQWHRMATKRNAG